MKKRPVFLIVQHLCPGGIEVLVLNLLNELKAQQELRIVALEGRKKDALKAWPILQQYEERLHFLNKREGLSPTALSKLIGLFLRYQPVAVHTHHIGPMMYGGLAARICGVSRLIHTEHDGWHLQQNGPKQAKIMNILKPKMIAVARNVAHSVAEKCESAAPHVIYNGIDTHRFSPGNQAMARLENNLPQDPIIIGCAGRLEEVKGHRYAIECLQHLPEHMHLAIAGDGSLKPVLAQHIQNLGLTGRVHLLGRIDDMRSFYRALDVFCLPSLNEGFPLSPLEAQACGVPAVLSNVGGCSEALCRDTGFLAAPGDSKDLAKKLQQALKANRQFSPRDFVLDHFDLSDIAHQYRALYTDNNQGVDCHA